MVGKAAVRDYGFSFALRHNTALVAIGSDPSAMAQDPTPFLRAFASLSGQGDRHAAPQATNDACRATPHLVWPHCAYGQAWLGMARDGRAGPRRTGVCHRGADRTWLGRRLDQLRAC
jgi:hypothetical protein